MIRTTTKMRGGRAFRLACHNSGTGIFDRVRTVRGGGACPKKKYTTPEWSVLKLGTKRTLIKLQWQQKSSILRSYERQTTKARYGKSNVSKSSQQAFKSVGMFPLERRCPSRERWFCPKPSCNWFEYFPLHRTRITRRRRDVIWGLACWLCYIK